MTELRNSGVGIDFIRKRDWKPFFLVNVDFRCGSQKESKRSTPGCDRAATGGPLWCTVGGPWAHAKLTKLGLGLLCLLMVHLQSTGVALTTKRLNSLLS
jgi:hypothetical protein